jgi:hypothetical protein
MRCWTIAALALILLSYVGAVPAMSQERWPASPLLAPTHWAVQAAARTEAMGLAPEYLPAQVAVPRHVVAAALANAAERVDDGSANPATAGMVEGWLARFREEFPEFRGAGESGGAGDGGAGDGGAGDAGAADGGAGAVRLLGSSAGVGSVLARGVGAPGLHEFPPDRTGATPIGDRSELLARAELAAALGGWFTVAATPELATDGARLDRAELTAGWGGVRISAGRAPVGYGPGAGGGVILSGFAPLDRLELSTTTPTRLPGWLGWLGPFAAHTFAAVLPDDRHPGSPWLWGVSASARPHPRFTISGHRALMIGGDGVAEPTTAADIIPAILGKNIVGVNQIASASFRLRLPTEGIAPLAVYCEWGAEDSAGSPFQAPGLICGGYSAALPGLPQVALGLEHAQFGARAEGGPPWYRHHMFPGNWALDEGPLGHPLGGEGRQWLLYGDLAGFAGRLRMDGELFWRERTGENLYVPGREGWSTGVTGELVWRVLPNGDLLLSGSREEGDGWAESRLRILSKIMF